MASLSVAVVASLIVFSALARKRWVHGLAIITGGVIVAACGFLVLDPSGQALRMYPEIARSYSGGAFNVPIYPHLPFLALAAITVAALAGLTRLVQHDRDPRLWVPAAAYAVLALATQRGAFGVAEPSRIAYYGLPVVLTALFVTARSSQPRVSRAWLSAAVLIGMMAPMQYYNVTEFLPFISQRLLASAPAAPDGSALSGRSTSGADVERNLRQVVETLGTERPYLMYEMEYNSLPVYRDFGLRYPTYAAMLMTARDHNGLQRAIEDVRARRGIVVIRKQDLAIPVTLSQSGSFRRLLDNLSGAHSAGSELTAIQTRSKSRLMAPFLQFLQTKCTVLYDRGDFMAFGAA